MKLYIVGWKDGSYSDPVTLEEARKMVHEARIHLGETVTVSSCDPWTERELQSSKHCDAGWMNDARFGTEGE